MNENGERDNGRHETWLCCWWAPRELPTTRGGALRATKPFRRGAANDGVKQLIAAAGLSRAWVANSWQKRYLEENHCKRQYTQQRKFHLCLKQGSRSSPCQPRALPNVARSVADTTTCELLCEICISRPLHNMRIEAKGTFFGFRHKNTQTRRKGQL